MTTIQPHQHQRQFPCARSQLRDASSQWHDAVERMLSARLFDESNTPAEYLVMLRRLEGAYRHLESCVERAPALRPLNEGRSKLPMLAADIGFLSERLKDAAHEEDMQPLPPPPAANCGKALGLGIMYVMEGATLGGQVICRTLSARPWLGEGRGLAFFNSYGDQRGLRWRQFLDSLQCAYENQPDSLSEMLAGARYAFSTLNDALSGQVYDTGF